MSDHRCKDCKKKDCECKKKDECCKKCPPGPQGPPGTPGKDGRDGRDGRDCCADDELVCSPITNALVLSADDTLPGEIPVTLFGTRTFGLPPSGQDAAFFPAPCQGARLRNLIASPSRPLTEEEGELRFEVFVNGAPTGLFVTLSEATGTDFVQNIANLFDANLGAKIALRATPSVDLSGPLSVGITFELCCPRNAHSNGNGNGG